VGHRGFLFASPAQDHLELSKCANYPAFPLIPLWLLSHHKYGAKSLHFRDFHGSLRGVLRSQLGMTGGRSMWRRGVLPSLPSVSLSKQSRR
jgi:hypothetical protein